MRPWAFWSAGCLGWVPSPRRSPSQEDLTHPFTSALDSESKVKLSCKGWPALGHGASLLTLRTHVFQGVLRGEPELRWGWANPIPWGGTKGSSGPED